MKKELSYDERRCQGIRDVLKKKSQYQMDRLYQSLMKRPFEDPFIKKPEKGKKKNEREQEKVKNDDQS